MEVAIALKKLSYRQGEKQILHDLDVSIPKGHFTALIGANGAGKTTLLRGIDRLIPTSGEIYLSGMDIRSLDEKELAKKLAFMKQETEMKFPFSVFETVLLGRYPHLSWRKREGEEDRKIARIYLHKTKTTDLADQSIQAISGGEKQRVMFARVLTQETPIILLDEPSSNLDIAHQEDIFAYAERFCRQGGTVIAAVHDLRLAAKYCQNLILMKEGRIVSQGEAGKVLTEENLYEAYGVTAKSYYNRITGEWQIYLDRAQTDKKARVHLIGGGGAGASALRQLFSAGYRVSLGVVNRGDTDAECAAFFRIPAVVNPPFSKISPTCYAQNLLLIEQADYVVLSSVCFGEYNLDNLRGLFYSKKLIILEDSEIGERDFTEGKAVKLYEQLKKEAVVLPSEELLSYLERRGE